MHATAGLCDTGPISALGSESLPFMARAGRADEYKSFRPALPPHFELHHTQLVRDIINLNKFLKPSNYKTQGNSLCNVYLWINVYIKTGFLEVTTTWFSKCIEQLTGINISCPRCIN